jgi:superoxide reductase
MEIKIYKCTICGNIVMKLNDKSEALVCCEKPMQLLKANKTDGAIEKHVPVVNKKVDGCADAYEVQVGSAPHPMLLEHFINWIASFNNDT